MEHLHPQGDFGASFLRRPPKRMHEVRLTWVILLTLATMVLEIVGGVLTNSLALLSDAAHMLTHLFALGITFFAIRLALRPATLNKTFGYYRSEILAALLNGFTILVIVGFIFYQSFKKLLYPEPVAVGEMLVIAVIGLIVNLVSAVILYRAQKNDLNIKGAFVHLLTDLFSSVAIVVGAIVIYFTGWEALDPLVSMVIGFVIYFWGIKLMADAIYILLEATPKHLKVLEVCQHLCTIPEVKKVHDAHIWTLTSGMYAMTAHIQVEDMPLKKTGEVAKKINELVARRYQIGHTNLQFEAARP